MRRRVAFSRRSLESAQRRYPCRDGRAKTSNTHCDARVTPWRPLDDPSLSIHNAGVSRVRVKICGVCRPDDARVAADAGADAVGMVRVEGSPRQVGLDEARAMAAVLPAFVTPVLLYLAPSADAVRHDLAALGRPAMVQFQGDVSLETMAALSDVPLLKAVRVEAGVETRLQALRGARLPNLVGLVLETPGQIGGSGVANDWTAVAALIREGAFAGLPPLVAAGGLTVETVADVIAAIRPYAVDVSSGVAESTREKSPAKIRAFIANATGVDRSR
jgi:phosphoribosylanthranilate isomerase